MFTSLCLTILVVPVILVSAYATNDTIDPLTADVQTDYVSTLNLDETNIDLDYYFAKLDEINNLRDQGNELNAVYTAREMYETLNMDVDLEFFSLCEQIAQMQIDQPELFTQGVGEIVEDAVENLLSTRSITTAVQEFLNLTFAEQTLVVTMPSAGLQVKECKTRANAATVSYFGYSGSGENSDAFRHAYWNALMSIELNKTLAKQFADAHEQLSSTYMNTVLACGYNGQRHTNMDLHNNQLGRDCVHASSTPTTAMNNIIQAIRDVKHFYLHANYNCNPNGIK